MERVAPRKPRTPSPEVVAARVANLDAKEALLLADECTLLSEPHNGGYPAVAIGLKEIPVAQMRALLGPRQRHSGMPQCRISHMNGRFLRHALCTLAHGLTGARAVSSHDISDAAQLLSLCARI